MPIRLILLILLILSGCVDISINCPDPSLMVPDQPDQQNLKPDKWSISYEGGRGS
jgi:hypothetical protein